MSFVLKEVLPQHVLNFGDAVMHQFIWPKKPLWECKNEEIDHIAAVKFLSAFKTYVIEKFCEM